jgi:hypothetical protein
MADLETGLTTELTAITGLSGKVYAVLAGQGTAAPYLVYSLDDTDREKTLDGYDGLIKSRYQFEFYHSTYAQLKALKALIIAEIKTWEQTNLGATGPYIQQIDISDESEPYELATKLHGCVIQVAFYFNE